MLLKYILPCAGLWLSASACEGCSHDTTEDVVLTRIVPRAQPDSLGAVQGPKGPLAWGQLNFLDTSDTHGWLEGHIKEQNYGADWGDFVSFVKHMNQTAINNNVDLLLVDTGDLHDGAGLSDATSPNGNISNVIFENLNYDLLSIGNHELYITDIAYETFNQFAKVYGDRYLTSNVQIINPSTGQFEYIGHQYRHFTTRMGLRVMAFGFLYDFSGNSNVSRVIHANVTVQQEWFKTAVSKPDIDLFIMLGHNPVRTTVSSSTFGTYYSALRSMRSDVPIQIFGGHTHIRDFVVYDEMATGLEPGRYCETLGWLSMTGFKSPYKVAGPPSLPHPTQRAVKYNATTSSFAAPKTNSTFRYSRSYLDWNRLTFEFHANGSQTGAAPSSSSSSASATSHISTSSSVSHSSSSSHSVSTSHSSSSSHTSTSLKGPPTCPSVVTVHQPPVTVTVTEHAPAKRQLDPAQASVFDTSQGVAVSNAITADRKALNLTSLYGCAPQSWFQNAAPFMSNTSIFNLLAEALSAVVYEPARKTVPRIILLNTGSIRFDLFQGPFTFDDSFIVSPFTDSFQFIPDVPYNYTTGLQNLLNHGSVYKRRDVEEEQLNTRSLGLDQFHLIDRDTCIDPPVKRDQLTKRGVSAGKIIRRQSTSASNPGYTTTDDFGTDGDDTLHTKIPYYAQPNYFQANVSFPADGSQPATVDVIFLDYFGSSVVMFLQQLGYVGVNSASVQQYLPKTFTTNSYLPAYAQIAPAWQKDVGTGCPLSRTGNYQRGSL